MVISLVFITIICCLRGGIILLNEKSSIPKILFVCGHNAGRSQIAEAFTHTLSGQKIKAASAGTHPATEINPIVIEVMKEVGISMRGYHPKLLTPVMWEGNTRIIGMG